MPATAEPASSLPTAATFAGIDAGLWVGAEGVRAAGGQSQAVGSSWCTVATSEGAVGDAAAAKNAAGGAAAVCFRTVAMGEFVPWLAAETGRLLRAAPVLARQFPRLDLPTNPVTREFLKRFPHAAFGAWVGALEGRGVRPLLMIRAGDYTKTALDLRHICSEHRARDGRHRIALILDDFAADDVVMAAAVEPTAEGAEAVALPAAGIRLGDHQPVWLLARGLPGCAAHEQGFLPEELSPATVARAEALYHAAVGELGTERILFGSGLDVEPVHPLERARRQAALAAWFCMPRDWLDMDSVRLMFGPNQQALLTLA